MRSAGERNKPQVSERRSRRPAIKPSAPRFRVFVRAIILFSCVCLLGAASAQAQAAQPPAPPGPELQTPPSFELQRVNESLTGARLEVAFGGIMLTAAPLVFVG